MSTRIRPKVTIFTSIPDVVESLLEACPDLPVAIITDKALGGYGGTVDFRPPDLRLETKSALKEAEVLISEPAVVAALLKHDVSLLASLKWCQSTYAGVDPLFNAGLNLPLPWTLTRFAGCFGPPIAEWTLARIVEHERSFACSAMDQTKKSWAGSREKVTNYRYLSSLTLSILGCGDIGTCIASAAKAFGMKTVGYTRSVRQSCSEGIDQHTTDLNSALQAGDYIVSVLPSTEETRKLLSNNALAPCSKTNGGKTPVLINVGRGDVIDEDSLISALDNGFISAAILDVFETEPLPFDSKLWDRQEIVISPHVSGLTQASDVPKVFLSNYERYVKGDELQYVVDWHKGY